jgi:hypothetical protein
MVKVTVVDETGKLHSNDFQSAVIFGKTNGKMSLVMENISLTDVYCLVSHLRDIMRNEIKNNKN